MSGKWDFFNYYALLFPCISIFISYYSVHMHHVCTLQSIQYISIELHTWRTCTNRWYLLFSSWPQSTSTQSDKTTEYRASKKSTHSQNHSKTKFWIKKKKKSNRKISRHDCRLAEQRRKIKIREIYEQTREIPKANLRSDGFHSL